MKQSMDVCPELPVISRFVAPWDTSGWYSCHADFQSGSLLYSNRDVYAQTMPQALRGGDWVVTFDACAEGLDDQQGFTFYVERPARVVVALEAACPGDFLTGFSLTDGEIAASDGTRYRLFAREYSQDEEVSLPGFTGNYHHYFVIACATTAIPRTPLPTLVVSPPVTEETPERDLRWPVYSTFFDCEYYCPPPGYICDGDVAVRPRPGTDGRGRCVRLKNGAQLQKVANVGRYACLECDLQTEGTVKAAWCGVWIQLNPDCCIYEGHSLALGRENYRRLRMLRREDRLEIWVDSRRAWIAPIPAGEDTSFRLRTEKNTEAWLTFLSIRDDTESPCVEERWQQMPPSLCVDPANSAEIVAYPFADKRSLLLHGDQTASCSYTFAAIRRHARVETTVKPMGSGFTLLCEVRNARGDTLLRVATLRRNLYATEGREWRRLTGGHIGGMYHPTGCWYRVNVEIDLEKNAYTLFVDGAERLRNAALACQASEIAQVGMMTAEGGLYVRELLVFAPRRMLPPTRILNVKLPPYGAVGDGQALDTECLQRALDDAEYRGDTVLLEDGIFRTGELSLRSDLTLYIAPNAVLLGVQDHAQYPLRTPSTSRCANSQLGRGLLYGDHLCNVRIMGGGTVDGNGRYRYKHNDPQDRERDARPCFVYIANSQGIVLEDVYFRSAAFWGVVPLCCRNLLLQRLNLDCCNTPNRDGIDPVDCHDLTVQDCCISAGDDGLCLKSSAIYGCCRIDVRGLVVQSLASGIKFGTDSYGMLRDAVFNDCILKNINRCGVSLESVDGAAIADVSFRYLDMTDVGAPVYLVLGLRNRKPVNGQSGRESSMERVRFENLCYEKPYQYCHTKDIHGILIVGADEKHEIRDIRFERCRLALPGGMAEQPPMPTLLGTGYPEYDRHGLLAGYAFTARFVRGLHLEQVAVALKQPDARPMLYQADCQDVEIE